MLNPNNNHLVYAKNDENGKLQYSWTMDKIERKDETVWIMNHFFVNPQLDFKQTLAAEMPKLLELSTESQLKIWPLDPAVISFFKNNPEYQEIWYQKPAAK